jgi:hypothetical protein
MVIAEPSWLHTLGQMAGTLLLIELVLVLLVVCALMIAIAIAARWLRRNVVPVVDQYGGQAQRYLVVAERGSDRVAHGVAEFHGRWEGARTAIRVFFLGRDAAQRVQAAPDGATGEGAAAQPGVSPIMGHAPQQLPSGADAALPVPRQGESAAEIEADGHTPPAAGHAG